MNYNRVVQGNDILIKDEAREIIRIHEDADESSMIFSLHGELLNEVAYELEDEMIAGLSVRNSLKVDMNELTYIGSFGLRSLLKVQHIIDDREKGELIFLNANSQIKDIFIQNGFLELFDFR